MREMRSRTSSIHATSEHRTSGSSAEVELAAGGVIGSVPESVVCDMLNLFVPVARPALGAPVRGLRFAIGGEIQRDMAARFAADAGTILCGYGGGMCLCGFADWPGLYELARDLRVRNAVDYVALLKFFSGRRYRLVERAVDLDDAEMCTPVDDGVLVVARCEPREPRRHRQVVRALSRSVGAHVVLRLKSGRVLPGVLLAFDPETQVGSVDDRAFVAGQVLAVEDSHAPSPQRSDP
jgi:hypothetical protein